MWATLRAEASGKTAATRAKLSRWDVVPRRRNWASATPNQAAGLAVQKLGSLKKRRLPGGLVAGGGVVLLHIHVSVFGRKSVSSTVENAGSPDVETRMVGSELNIFSNIIGAFINISLAD